MRCVLARWEVRLLLTVGWGQAAALVCKAPVPDACPQNNTDTAWWRRRAIPRDVPFEGSRLYPALIVEEYFSLSSG